MHKALESEIRKGEKLVKDASRGRLLPRAARVQPLFRAGIDPLPKLGREPRRTTLLR